MNSAQKQLYWVKSHKIKTGTLRNICSLETAVYFVFCTENEVNPDLTSLKQVIRKHGKNFIEMPGDPETIIPSLARVLKVDEVVLLNDHPLDGGAEKIQEIRHRLNMHSIAFREPAGKTPIHTTLQSLFPALDWFSDPGLHRLPPAF